MGLMNVTRLAHLIAYIELHCLDMPTPGIDKDRDILELFGLFAKLVLFKYLFPHPVVFQAVPDICSQTAHIPDTAWLPW